MKKNLLFATLIAASALMVSCGGQKKEVAAVAPVESKVVIKTEAATSQQVAQTEVYTADLRPYKQNFISPSMAVRIEEIYVEVGDKVKKGQLLARMDKNQYNQQVLQLKNAEVNLARMKAVYESGGASKQSVDELETNIEIMRQTVANLEENLELRSPIDGVVTGRFNEAGDLYMMAGNAAGGVGMLQVMQINPLKAIVAIPEQYIPQVQKGMKVTVNSDTYPDLTFSGEVSLVYPSVNASTRTFDVEVTIPNNYSTLRPGMFARTTFNMGNRESVVVSDLAIVKQAGVNDKFVYVIKDGKAEYRKVTVGRQVADKVEILSGLQAGEVVAVAGLSRLADGAEVDVRN